MKFPEHFSPEQCNDLINKIFAPYLQELETICEDIASSISLGTEFSKTPIARLRGKLSVLQGILKGIELERRNNDL